jgi:hypothetical protein
MNERIRQLAVEAGFYANPDIEKFEKFAEPIVRECAQIGELKEQGYSEYDPDISVGWYMRQHFGVEE